jgi:hypothetical protein
MQNQPGLAYVLYKYLAKHGFSPTSAGGLRPLGPADRKAEFSEPSLAPRAIRIPRDFPEL